MFGHQDEPVQQATVAQEQQIVAPVDTANLSAPVNPALPPAGMSFGAPAITSTPAPIPAQAAPVTDPHNLLESQAADGYTTPPVEPAAAVPEPTTPAVGVTGPLADLKQQALQQLSPLVSQLEQSPEEKFRTTMMLIQASDNQDLLQAAYDAANQIADEKARAQALLDVINEINYFSQQAN